MFGYENGEKTPVGKILILDLPERVAMEASMDKPYFSENNGLFRKLFASLTKMNRYDYSSRSRYQSRKMRFFVGNKDIFKKIESSEQVKLIKISPRKVVSIGIRGGYTEKKFQENLKHLNNWLDGNTSFEADGMAYGVYWNGPFIPGLFKRSEIHIPIRLSRNRPNENSSNPKPLKQK